MELKRAVAAWTVVKIVLAGARAQGHPQTHDRDRRTGGDEERESTGHRRPPQWLVPARDIRRRDANFAVPDDPVIGRMTDARRRAFALHCRPMDAMVGSVRSPLLIGRDELLELVDRRLDDVDVGRGQFLLVAGIAGIGKSRLLWSIGRKARDRGFRDAWGHLAPQDQDVPAASIRDFARTARIRAGLGPTMGRDILAMLECRTEVEPDGTSEAGARRRRAASSHVPDRPKPVRLRGPPMGGRPEPRRHRATGAARSRPAHPPRGGLPERRAAPGFEPPGLAVEARDPADRRGATAGAACPRRRPRSSRR